MKHKGLALFLFACLTLMAACTASTKPEDVFMKYWNAVQSGNWDKASETRCSPDYN